MHKLNPAKARRLSELFDHGLALLQGGDAEAAIYAFETAQKLAPAQFDVLHMLGVANFAARKPAQAISLIRRALSIKPTDAMAYMNLGLAQHQQGSLAEALASLRKAAQLQPDDLRIIYNLANTLTDAGNTQEAVTHYQHALHIQPDCAEVLHALCNALRDIGAYMAAAGYCKKLMQIEPQRDRIDGRLLHLKARACLWNDFESDCAKTLTKVEQGLDAAEPFDLLSIPSTPAQQRVCAHKYAGAYFPAQPTPLWQEKTSQPERIRIGYFSADFHDHATAYLMAELFEKHDRSRFEIHAFSFGPKRSGAMRARLQAAFEHFLDVETLNDAEIAQLARKHGIDIAIDLKGYTTHSRAGIFAHRAAPIQVNYLGYPGTMGASFMDYIIADATLIREGDEVHYTEKVVRLPHSYQPNDQYREIAAQAPERATQNLPDKAFVFCCFNNNFKITLEVFAIWMQLLLQKEGSVLWLLEDNKDAANSLLQEARQHGVCPSRLIFAPRLDLPAHLARHRHADLFLDTFYYNAHTTASDALWTGLPVLTLPGETFASRVAASLLNALDFPELIATNPDDYAAKALHLAHSATDLQTLRQKLACNRSSHPLFDATRLTRNIEHAYSCMWLRQQQGLPPAALNVPNQS
ncbi:hypothetical protein GCM10027046_12490 [Uliginosibacterium flavum]|uniref:protein O-GlcNAc transferase n=1 Tax=Uliginosibacterium flavum TaxID=1396831 RepID=A0ABV2TL80_9RHOO